MDKLKVKIVLTNLEVDLEKYQQIMRRFHDVNVKEDKAFQRIYKDFYGFRHPRVHEFSDGFFEYLESNKRNTLEYADVLRELEKFGRLEASFASKLIATIDPNKPIIDRHVLNNIGLKLPGSYSNNRFGKVIKLYEEIIAWYENYLSTEESKEMVKMFDEFYPCSDITDIKKIDLILWQMR